MIFIFILSVLKIKFNKTSSKYSTVLVILLKSFKPQYIVRFEKLISIILCYDETPVCLHLILHIPSYTFTHIEINANKNSKEKMKIKPLTIRTLDTDECFFFSNSSSFALSLDFWNLFFFLFFDIDKQTRRSVYMSSCHGHDLFCFNLNQINQFQTS